MKIVKHILVGLMAIVLTIKFCDWLYNRPVKDWGIEAEAAEISTHTVDIHSYEIYDKTATNDDIFFEEEKEDENIVWYEFEATAYCSCERCCGKSDGITASGAPALENVTVAMDSSIPFFTHIYIEGMGERIVQDRGGAINENKIDIYFDSHEDALNFGKQQIKLYFMEEYQ